MNRIDKNLIKNIKELLKIKKLNQNDLCKVLNMPKQTISRILNGDRSISSDELKKIADYLNVDIDSLYFDEEGVHLKKKAILYHGSPNKKFVPKFKGGEDKHDYGNGFYLSAESLLAKEWAICNIKTNGYLHKYELNTEGLRILYINEKYDVLTWLATLAKHRSADESKRYKINAEKLINKYYRSEIEEYDVIVGYRADDSYFYFAKNAIKNELDISLLELVMKTGNLGYQIFIQSKKAFKQLKEIEANKDGYYQYVDNDEYSVMYDEKDHFARRKVAEIIESDENTLSDTIEKYLG